MNALRLTEVAKSTLPDAGTLAKTLTEQPPALAEVTVAFDVAMKRGRSVAVHLATAYAQGLPDIRSHRAFFQHLALLKKDQRRAGIEGYRAAGLGDAVVNAIGYMPAAQGRVVMKDFLHDAKGKRDRKAFKDVGKWLARAGAAMVRAQDREPEPEPDFDSAVVEWVEGAVDELVGAVKAVVDAVVNAVGDVVAAIAGAVADVVNWAIEEVVSFVRAVISAGRTIAQLVEGAWQASFQVLKAILRGLEQAGKALYEVLSSIVDFTGELLKDALRAIDQIGRTLGELLDWLSTQIASVVAKFVEAMIAIGKEIGNILLQTLKFGASMMSPRL
jgi:hypothetical protein